MKKQLVFFFFLLILGGTLQNCKYAKIDSVANNAAEVGFTTINAKARIIDYKDGTPTAHGHCYSATIEIPEVGLAGTDTTETPFVSVDFESKIDSLIFDKEYFVRPYMRNGTKIVYGEVKKISTKTPNVAIKNIVLKDSTTSIMLALADSLIAIDIVTNEPLKVLPLPLGAVSREYGFVFGKGDTLRIDNGFPPTTNPNILDIRFSSTNDITTDRRNLKLNLKRNNPAVPNTPTGVTFFGTRTPNTVFSMRAYIKLSKESKPKYYYSDRVLFKIKQQL